MIALRHKWGDPNRLLYKTERVCLRCDLIKVTRHEPTATWIEWWRDGERITCERTPACAGMKAEANSGTEPTVAPIGTAQQPGGGTIPRFPAYPQAVEAST